MRRWRQAGTRGRWPGPVRREEPVRRGRRGDAGRIPHQCRSAAGRAGRGDRGSAAAGGGGAGRRAEHGRVRLWLHDREQPLRPDAQPARSASGRGRIVGRLRQPQWRPGSCPSPSARTPTARSACHRPSAESSGSSRPMGACPGRARRSSRRASITWAPSRAPLRDTAAAFDVIQGPDADDPVSSNRAPEPCLPHVDEGVAGTPHRGRRRALRPRRRARGLRRRGGRPLRPSASPAASRFPRRSAPAPPR